MKAIGLVLVALMVTGSPALAAKKNRASGKNKAADAAVATAEVAKLKGDYAWGMRPEQVMETIIAKVRESYATPLKEAGQDPSRYDRLQKQLRGEIDQIKKRGLVQFTGKETGYDVSVIDQEFARNVSEAMLMAKEEKGSRYFFFVRGTLYKMFIAFHKDVLQGKSFTDFGDLMQNRFGPATPVHVDQTSKGKVTRQLDHYLWTSDTGDGLRLVDRSGFYDVYCLVLYSTSIEAEQLHARQAIRKKRGKDALVEAVTAVATDGDMNDNIIDQITGREVVRPGDEAPPEKIVVPMPSVHAPTPDEINRSDESKPKQPAKPASGRPASKGLDL
jgi:hypothetical protein